MIAVGRAWLLALVLSVSLMLVALFPAPALAQAAQPAAQGVITGHEARRRGIGGEVICSVW